MRTPRIRVMHVMPTGCAGGIESCVVNLARHIDRDKFALSVCVVGEGGHNSDALKAAGVPTWILHAGESRARGGLAFANAIRIARPQIVHIHAGGRMVRSIARAASGGRLVSHFHGSSADWSSPELAVSARTEIRNTFVRGAARLLACSDHSRSMLTTLCPELAGRIEVVRPGIDPGQFTVCDRGSADYLRARTKLGLSSPTNVIGFIGRLVPQKGVELLIDAGLRLKRSGSDFTIVVVGDGPLRAALEAAAQNVVPGRVVFLGERHDVSSLLPAMDIVAVPSRWEPFGIVVLEAMAAARPVVASQVGGIPEIISNDITGLMTPAGDADALASSIGALLQKPDLAAQMGLAGRQRVQAEFQVGAFVRQLEEIYGSMARSH